MLKYAYKVKDNGGLSKSGTLWAESREEVYIKLRREYAFVLSIEEAKEKTRLGKSIRKSWKTKDVIEFSYQMALMLEAGISIRQVLQLLVKKQKSSIPYVYIYENIKRGRQLSETLKTVGFPPIGIVLIEVGELAGTLDQTFWIINQYFVKEKRFKEQIVSAITYPLFLVVVLLTFCIVMLVFILPAFQEVFNTMGMPLPPLTKLTFDVGHFVQTHILYILGSLLLCIASISVYYESSSGHLRIHTFIWKYLAKYEWFSGIFYARIVKIWSLLLDAGIPMSEMLVISEPLWGNVYAMRLHQEVRQDVQRGQRFNAALQKHTLGNPFIWDLLMIGEESGETVKMMSHIANYYESRMALLVKKFQQLLEPILLSIMGILIGFLVVTVMLPMFNSISVMTNL